MKQNMKQKKKPENERKLGAAIKSQISRALEIPKEVVANLPIISMIGSEQLEIENYKGIIEYTTEKIRVGVSGAVLKIEGRNLALKELTAEAIRVTGVISGIEFV